jgi:hypothetical protein
MKSVELRNELNTLKQERFGKEYSFLVTREVWLLKKEIEDLTKKNNPIDTEF